jgi:hypothetical protein
MKSLSENLAVSPLFLDLSEHARQALLKTLEHLKNEGIIDAV